MKRFLPPKLCNSEDPIIEADCCFQSLPLIPGNILQLSLQKEADATGRHTRAEKPPPLLLVPPPPPPTQWLNIHSYKNTAALTAQQVRPGWGCTAAEKAHFNDSD